MRETAKNDQRMGMEERVGQGVLWVEWDLGMPMRLRRDGIGLDGMARGRNIATKFSAEDSRCAFEEE